MKVIFFYNLDLFESLSLSLVDGEAEGEAHGILRPYEGVRLVRVLVSGLQFQRCQNDFAASVARGQQRAENGLKQLGGFSARCHGIRPHEAGNHCRGRRSH